MQNRYPLWKNLLLIMIFVVGLIYAMPMLFGDDPAIQISAKGATKITQQTIQTVTNTLKTDKIAYGSVGREKNSLLVRFPSTDVQLKARDLLTESLGNNYIVALNLAPRTPAWLAAIGAQPMKLGLDLRGGVYFLLEVDVNALIETRERSDMHSMGDALRDANIRYAGISRIKPNGVLVRFRDSSSMKAAYNKLVDHFRGYQLLKITDGGRYQLKATMTQAALIKVTNYAIDQTMSILNNRVNALGVSEAVVQRQGQNHISVELPGIQDTARAKSIIGQVATLRFQMVDDQNDAQAARQGDVPVGDTLYMTDHGAILLKDRVILHGSAITYATSSFDQSGRPSVNVRLGGTNEVNDFNNVTANSVGKQMAVVYVETIPQKKIINGKTVIVHHRKERVISVATIDSALGNNFQITGLSSAKYAQNLALLLRSGAYRAPINFVQERTVGPSLGKANIHMGMVSIVVGFLFVVIFMAIYYLFFGLIADMALFLNLVFIVAVFSILGVTLTLPGIAAMVLTVGMAVDANVLIYERIREELRNGVSPQASIHLGYERAFTTIVDSNVTTLIVALVLFSFGSGAVKGFAVTLIVGLLTSMVTSIVYTRSVVNVVYGGKNVKRLLIGIKN